jgi:hypothetical protein
MSAADGVRCLDDELSEYAAGRLPAHRVRAWQRHLAVCDLCAIGLERERRLQSALAGGPSMPVDLRDALMAMGRGMHHEPAVPRPAGEPLALLAPGAPPCHRSPLRATVVAAAAAGVSAAAAWSLTVVGAPSTASQSSAVPTVVRNAAATPTPGSTADRRSASARWMPVGAAVLVDDEQAQSGP